jgi:hypothetical protein
MTVLGPFECPGEPMAYRTRLLRPLSAELEFLRATSDRADPLDEAVLNVVEAAVLAMDAAERARACDGTEDFARVHGCLTEVLGAARAAVTAATFALVEAKDESLGSARKPEDDTSGSLAGQPQPALP